MRRCGRIVGGTLHAPGRRPIRLASALGVLLLVALTLGMAPLAAQIPGSEELCVVMRVADEVRPSVDTIHVVIQGPRLREADPVPPDRWFEPRGLTMAVGARPTDDTLEMFLTVDRRELIYVRTRRSDDRWVGLIGFHRSPASSRRVELVEVACPG